MQPRIWIKELEFNDGTKIPLDERDIIVFLGPNNSGKSTCLNEINNLIKSTSFEGKIIKSIKTETSGSLDDLISTLDNLSIKDKSNKDINNFYIGYKFMILRMSPSLYW